METATVETAKRLRLGGRQVERFSDIATGIVMAGSVAYAPNLYVTEQSDLDLVLVVPNLKAVLSRFVDDPLEREKLENRFFEAQAKRPTSFMEIFHKKLLNLYINSWLFLPRTGQGAAPFFYSRLSKGKVCHNH